MKGRISMLLTSLLIKSYMGFSGVLIYLFLHIKRFRQKLFFIKESRKQVSRPGNVMPRGRVIPLTRQEKLRVLESTKVH